LLLLSLTQRSQLPFVRFLFGAHPFCCVVATILFR
jgi:hypothetical protein